MKTLFSVLLGLLVAASALAGTSFESFCDFKFGSAYHKDNGKHTLFQEMIGRPISKFNQCQIRLNGKREICEVELRARRPAVLEKQSRAFPAMNEVRKFEEYALRKELVETFSSIFPGVSFDQKCPDVLHDGFTGTIVRDYRPNQRLYWKYVPSKLFPTRRDRGNDVYWLGKIIERGEDGGEKKTKLVRLAANSAYLAVTVTDMKLAAETAKKKR